MNAPPTAPIATPGGIHISRGITPRISAKGLELQLDTCVLWLEIALDNLASAKQIHEELVAAKIAGANHFPNLDAEFKASVQATVAAATFFEALYAAVLERLPNTPTKTGARRRQKPPRFAVVAEALRAAFGLRKNGTANLRNVLKEVYRFRDQAVHPSSAFSEPVLHPTLGVGVEQRFIMFSYSSAYQLVRAALAFSKILPSRDLTRRPKAIQDFSAYLLGVCGPLYLQWEQDYGQLLDSPVGTP